VVGQVRVDPRDLLAVVELVGVPFQRVGDRAAGSVAKSVVDGATVPVTVIG